MILRSVLSIDDEVESIVWEGRRMVGNGDGIWDLGSLPLPDSTKCLLKIDKSRLFLFPSSDDEAGAVSMDELKKEATPNSKKVAPKVASGLPPNSNSYFSNYSLTAPKQLCFVFSQSTFSNVYISSS